MSIIYVRDLVGDEYTLQSTTTYIHELNGNQSLSFTVLPSKVNLLFIHDITKMWEVVDDNDVTHKVIYAKKRGEGSLLTVEIKAIPLFFDTFDNSRIYEEYNEYMTAMNAFTRIFEDMPFGFILVDPFEAVDWEGFGAGESRLETFKRALNRYKAEFRIVGNTVYLERQIGRDTSFMYRYKLNASNIVKEIDAGEYWTYAKGYGDYGDGEGGGDWQDAGLIREYTSPLAKILGKRDAPPIKDGRIKVASAMDKALKTLVDGSLKISITTDIHDLRRQGYAIAQPEVGDRVFVIDERIGLDEEVRVIDVSVTKDWRGNVLDLKLTIGSESLTKRHQSNMSTAVDTITNWISGKDTVPFDILGDAVKNATNALRNAQTELIFNTSGIIARDKSNPNLLTIFNSAGIGVSNDGGNTFKNSITGNGVIAETIIGQSIIGVNLASANNEGYFHVNGSDAEFYSTGNGRRVTLSPTGLYGYNSGGDIRFQADQSMVTSAVLGTSNWNVYLAAASGKEARVVDVTQVPSDGAANSYTYLPLRASGFYGNYIDNNSAVSGPNLYLRPRSGGAVRVTASGTTDIYYDIHAANHYGTGFITTTTNAYIGTDSELRIVNKGLSNIYRDIRAQVFIGTRVRLSDSYNATNFYIQTANDGEVHVTGRVGTDSFKPIRASSFPTGTSLRENKENIEVFGEDVIGQIKNSHAYLYNIKGDEFSTQKQLGLMVDETPRVLHGEAGDSIEMYALGTYVYRGVQQLAFKADEQDNRILALEDEIRKLKRMVK